MNILNSDVGEGYLVVRVSTARGAIPVEGAEIIIRKSNSNDSEIIASMVSSNVGLTPHTPLPAPPRSLSKSPGNIKPFATYNIEVRAEGYSMQYYNEVPIFDGITSYQNAILIPLPDNVNSDNYTYDFSKGFESLQQLREEQI